MCAVAALLDSRTALGSLRRTLPRGLGAVYDCRTTGVLDRVLRSRLLDAVVLGTRAHRQIDLLRLKRQFPRLPIVVYGTIKSEEGGTLLEACERTGVAALVVEGVDDPVAGDIVARHGLTARRAAELADLPRLLHLTEPLQRAAFDLLRTSFGRPPPTATIARRLRVSREHLSRQFGAGGAPNLKRVIDLLQVLAAREMLANPGYRADAVASLLGYSTASHLRLISRRVIGLSLTECQRASLQELLRRFVVARGRSRE